MTKENIKLTGKYKCFLWIIRIVMNIFVGLLIAGSGVLIWFLLRWEVGIDGARTGEQTTMIVPIIITIIIMVVPVLFSWMTRYERLSSPC